MRMLEGQRNTSRVTAALSQAFGLGYGEEKRAGKWGFYIGNIWAKDRKTLHTEALELLEMGFGKEDWKEILLTSTDSNGYEMFIDD